MSFSDNERLRSLIGESIPLNGGTEDDTLFTNEQIDDLLSRHGTPEASMGEAWAMKAAQVAGLVDTIEGASQRHLSDLHKHAMQQAKLYGWGGSTNRTRIGSIVRPQGTAT